MVLLAVATGSGAYAGPLSGTEPTGFELLTSAYRAAHTRGAIGELMALVAWDGVDERTRGAVERSLKEGLVRAIRSIDFATLADDELLEYHLEGVTDRPNHPPLGRLVVAFEPDPDDPTAFTDSGDLIGGVDGTLRIVLATPVAGDP